MGGLRSFFKAIGSLWLAVVLLMLLLVTMAAATAYESMHGTPLVQAVFYQAAWFHALIALLALNILAAMLSRFPFSRRQIGMVITHSAILVVLLGALVTKKWGIDGRLDLWEGEPASFFPVQQECLIAKGEQGLGRASLDFDPSLSVSLKPVDLAGRPTLRLGDFAVAVERYLPDSEEVTEVKDDNPDENMAVEVVFTSVGQAMRHWIFADDAAGEHSVTIKLQMVDDLQSVAAEQAKAPASQPASQGTLKVTHGSQTYEYQLEQVTTRPATVGDSGYSVRVLRYMPHAVVEKGGVRNASSRPKNPAVEVEITGPGETTRQLAFARFPDFQSMHGRKDAPVLKLTLEVSDIAAETRDPIKIYAAKTGQLGVLFSPEGDTPVFHEFTLGQVVDTPWPGISFEISKRFDHARVVQNIVPVELPNERTIPAILVQVSCKDHHEQRWLRKGVRTPLVIDDGTSYSLTFTNKTVPLGFDITLDRFRIGKYPGTDRPRTYESQVTFTDPAGRGQSSKVISMNRPAAHGRYVFYQSDYDFDPGGKPKSILSVSWNPGQPIVFIGYVFMFVGMIWVLVSRMIGRRKKRSANDGDLIAGQEVVQS